MKRTYKPLLLLIPALMFVTGLFIVWSKYLKMTEDQIIELITSTLDNIFIALLIGICLGIIGAILPYSSAVTRRTIGYSRRTWEIATLVAFIFFALPFLGLAERLEYMIFLGIASTATFCFYIIFFFIFGLIQPKRKRVFLGGETRVIFDRNAPEGRRERAGNIEVDPKKNGVESHTAL